jgi:hypothetical protein
MGQRRGNGGKRSRTRPRGGGESTPGDRIIERLTQTLVMETSIPPVMIQEVIEDMLGLISSELEDINPDPDVEVALSPQQLHEQLMEWGYRASDLSEEDVDRILSRLILEMSRLSAESSN